MRKLLKSKKGFDWAFLIAGVTLICLVFLFFQLNKKMEHHDKPIGEMQMDMIDLMQKGNNVLFYLDQSARLSACDAIYSLADKGGFSSPPCGQTLPLLEQGPVPVSYTYSFWYKDKSKCYENADFYAGFKDVFNDKFKSRIDDYNIFKDKYSYVPPYNYEFMVTDDLIVGSAIKSIEMKKVSAVAGELGEARYVFKPSFAIDFKTGIDDYFSVQSVVDSLISCDKPMQECINDINTPGLKWSFEMMNPATYLFKVEQENIDCRFTEDKPVIRFAIEKTIALPPPIPAPLIPVP